MSRKTAVKLVSAKGPWHNQWWVVVAVNEMNDTTLIKRGKNTWWVPSKFLVDSPTRSFK